jgi:hypothetical protein
MEVVQVVVLDDPTGPLFVRGSAFDPIPFNPDATVAISWLEQSVEEMDSYPLEKGYRTPVTELWVSSEDVWNRIGYLKLVTLSPAPVLDMLHTNVFDWMGSNAGWGTYRDDDLAAMWAGLHLYAKRSPVSCPHVRPWSLSAGSAPDEETMVADLEVLAGHLEERFADRVLEWRSFGAGWHVAMSRVNETWQCRGLGAFMYRWTAGVLAERHDVPLLGSLRPSDAAQRLWARLASDPMFCQLPQGTAGGQLVSALDAR